MFYGRGVKDLYEIYTKFPDLLYGASIADKVVGKAAAALMILGKVKSIYADTMSDLALEILRNRDIDISFDKIVPHIINRDNTDLCPLEKATRNLEGPKAVLAEIKRFMEELE